MTADVIAAYVETHGRELHIEVARFEHVVLWKVRNSDKDCVPLRGWEWDHVGAMGRGRTLDAAFADFLLDLETRGNP